MGYFSNSSEADEYESDVCRTCNHYNPCEACPMWEAQQLWNDQECKKPESLLHKIIPRKPWGNDICLFHTNWVGMNADLENYKLRKWKEAVDSTKPQQPQEQTR